VTSTYAVIIPAYNEERRIRSILEDVKGDPGQFIMVCDGTDGTAGIVREFSSSHPDTDLLCVEFSERLGKGRAIVEGFFRTDAPVVGFLDADGSTTLAQMKKLMKGLDGSDAVIGSRWMPGSVIPEPQGLSRQMESRVFNLLVRLLFGLKLTDTQCGAKVFKKSAIDAVIRDMISTGFEFDVELLWRLAKKGYIIHECPITWNNQGDSRVKAGDAFRMLAGLIKIRLQGETTK
jgi:dolichol-phosphate mannosyltransferase